MKLQSSLFIAAGVALLSSPTAAAILGGDGLLAGRTDSTTTATTDAAAATGTSTTECGGPSNTRCATGYVCIWQAGNECGAAGGLGRCEATGMMMCSQDYDPVCGCDAKTYSNACVAQYERGVSVWTKGECPKIGTPPQPAATTDSATTTDIAATIDSISSDLPATTDGSSSSSGAEGGLLQPRPCGGPSGATCPLTQFCKLAEGTCTTSTSHPEGTCSPKPLSSSCNDHTLASVTQVCGCDGRTYRTDCHAFREGVSVLYRGACFSQGAAAANEEANARACGGRNGLLAKRCTGDAGSYCQYEQGVCGLYDAAGTCMAKPEVCADVVDPVCGCDGKTYMNQCQMQVEGVSLKSLGTCNFFHTIDDGLGGGGGGGGGGVLAGKQLDARADNSTNGLCNPTEGMPCPDGYYCAFEQGKCLTKKEMGICVVQPASCTPSSSSHPVCACSGFTFATECDAAMAGESLVSHSACLEMSSGAIASGAAARGVLFSAFAMAAAALALAGLV